MRIKKETELINLVNTNGRRNDLLNSYYIYSKILLDNFENGANTWSSFPASLGQYNFYVEALENSKGVFKRYSNYDYVRKWLAIEDNLSSFESLDKESVLSKVNGKTFLDKLSGEVEARSRHYTSNLVNIGISYPNRGLTPVGKTFVNETGLVKDSFEKLLPIKEANLIILRQLLKLRVYDKDYSYFNPFVTLLRILLNDETYTEKTILTVIMMQTPSIVIGFEDLLKLIDNYSVDEILGKYNENFLDLNLIDKIKNSTYPPTFENFSKVISNRKSGKIIPIYYEYFTLLNKLILSLKNKSADHQNAYSSLTSFIKNKENRKKLISAFGKENIVSIKSDDLQDFLDNNKEILQQSTTTEQLFLKMYIDSTIYKRLKNIKENVDTFKRLLSATGIIHFKNGIISLSNRDVWLTFLNDCDLSTFSSGSSFKKEYENYEFNNDAFFFSNTSISTILMISKQQIETSINLIMTELSSDSAEIISKKLSNDLNDKFIDFVKREYPREKVLEILSLFSDRNNDGKIIEMVSPYASAPTIFEYIVGLAWYYFSDKKYNLFNSFNLSMNADFSPMIHAGGNSGDIVIEYDDSITMIEATLMNSYAQKKGEWEPVLRHAVNLTVEAFPKKVLTVFIADELDQNTINIWRAVAMVPLYSTNTRAFGKQAADNVTIMPLKNIELINLINTYFPYTEFKNKVNESFENLDNSFDHDWREDLIKSE